MPSDVRTRARVAGLCAIAALAALGCQVSPPRVRGEARLGTVRAATLERADEIARLLDTLAPAVVALVPDTSIRTLEVWVQDEPALYAFPTSTYSDADGFWAEGPGRIHLRDRCDNIERTLAHEIVHASLGPSWRMLPGTLEEGLCDVVAARLCPDAAARLRAGRLSSAAFATGGLVVEVELDAPLDASIRVPVGFAARMRLEGDPPARVDPLSAFDVEAGLSSTDLSSESKKALYGISFLAVERIVDHAGFEGLHELCAEARAAGRAEVPIERLLEIAGLGFDAESWRLAIREAFGAAELEELVRAHPEFVATLLTHVLAPERGLAARVPALEEFHARLSVEGNPRSEIDLGPLASLRPEVQGLLRGTAALARR